MQTISRLDEQRLRLLIDAGRSLLSERELEHVLARLLEVARELTGARYAAIGVLDERREGLADFVTSGLHPEVHAAISELPRGRGVLGLLLSSQAPLRIADVTGHARFYGFPAGHPPMRSFLGAPILIGAEAWGNLYLADKQLGREFDEADEESAMVLSGWAATAIEDVRRNRGADQRRAQFEQSVQALETTAEIARAVGSEARLGRVLELVAERSRALVSGSAVGILLDEEHALIVAALADEVPGPIVSSSVGKVLSIAAGALASGLPDPLSDPGGELQRLVRELGFETRAAIFAPLLFRGDAVGVIGAFDRIDGPQFRAADEPVIRAAGECAATAFATTDPTELERWRRTLQAVELDLRRAVPERNEEKLLQTLGSLRAALAAAHRQSDLAVWQRTGAQAIETLKREIDELRATITDRG